MTGRKELMGLARETNTDSTLLLLKSLQNSRPHPIVLRHWNIILRLLLRKISWTHYYRCLCDSKYEVGPSLSVQIFNG